MRQLVLIIAVFLPQTIKKLIYRRFMGWEIGKNVKIGFSYLGCQSVTLKDGVSIGHFNIVRRLRNFYVGQDSSIKNFNQFFFSGNLAESPEWAGVLNIGRKVNFMSHHFIDLGGSVFIGDQTTVAGRDTHFWSHGFVPSGEGRQHIRTKISIGENVYIGARATLLGCAIPSRAIVGAGSIVTKSFAAEESRLLIAGNPAAIKKRYEVAQLDPSVARE
ncbi:MAG: DapH/DapD/GlmU-related protein [Cyanobacteria bacterium J06600_6]